MTPAFDWVLPMVIASMAVPLLITILVIGLIIWAIRRQAPRREDPAVEVLKARYAAGEIDQAEFEVRLRSLTRDRD